MQIPPNKLTETTSSTELQILAKLYELYFPRALFLVVGLKGVVYRVVIGLVILVEGLGLVMKCLDQWMPRAMRINRMYNRVQNVCNFKLFKKIKKQKHSLKLKMIVAGRFIHDKHLICTKLTKFPLNVNSLATFYIKYINNK